MKILSNTEEWRRFEALEMSAKITKFCYLYLFFLNLVLFLATFIFKSITL